MSLPNISAETASFSTAVESASFILVLKNVSPLMISRAALCYKSSNVLNGVIICMLLIQETGIYLIIQIFW